MPIGSQTTMNMTDAALVYRDYLKNCHTIIPMLFKLSEEPEFEQESTSLFGVRLRNVNPVSRLEQELANVGTAHIRIIDPEEELLGHWFDL
eukprot:CAMPEP_0185573480 /NCGR_PEP_ID=MMETSP0434-20130131/5174_1 /TAXON_ID=626734 ORGANISM="Favella taraikaensis, Strain Fe Narragansett Bay" /NCGR_SAMPLE_ID=MMETSP0434 /ASSEMBLY_ACC=CAM_ASM_000379 /LENGTH=90 /DNA_ID=CAMNT_0028189711 /DNA_START=734 /DNA_END=1006 /DNA_ORIENTATION=+